MNPNPFPRIHSLGTINIIHHQEFFYEFHPFRTDFVGDSGVGKSIITDLLQLILIGSTEYSSSTQSKDDRPFNTLVLKNTDNTDFGYAYINVEINPNQYFVLGSYIARNQNLSQAFIIQKSLDFDSDILTPLSEPVIIDSFEKEGKWLPIDELDLYFNDEKDIGFKKFRRFSQYHQVLHSNKLLPLDVTTASALKDYAKILQTFARKNINIKDGVDLQDFLFGKHWRNHFHKQYEDVVADMKEDISTYRTNREDLDRIEQKKIALQELYALRKQLSISQTTWQHLHYHSLSLRKAELEKELKTNVKKYFVSRSILSVLKKLKTQKIDTVKNELPIMQELQNTRSEEVNKLHGMISDIRAIENLMNVYNLDDEKAIFSFYKKFNMDRILYKALQQGKVVLEEKGLIEQFDALDHTLGLGNLLTEIQSNISTKEGKLKIHKALLACNDVDNPNSLIFWALNHQPQLTPEQESIILYYQNESIQTTQSDDSKVGDLYIPEPKVVLKASLHKTKNGFWADFGGVYTFFTYPDPDQRLFDGRDEQTIINQFNKNRELLQKNIAKLQLAIKTESDLFSFLKEYKEVQNLLEAWKVKDQLTYESIDLDNEFLSQNEEQFQKSLQVYRDKDKRLTEYQKAEKERDELTASIKSTELLQQQLERFVVTEPGPIDPLLQELYDSYKLVLSEENAPNFDEDAYYADFKEFHGKALAGLNVLHEVMNSYKVLKETEGKLTELELAGDLNPEQVEPEGFSEEKVNEARKDFEEKNEQYAIAFGKLIANTNIVENDLSRLEQTKDFKTLVTHVLPGIFRKVNFEESEVMQKISEYLDEINRKNAEITKNKLVHIRDLMQELHKEVARQTNAVRIIDNELNKEEAQISGGLKASLKDAKDTRIQAKWISDFLDKMPAINEGLFDPANQAYFNEAEQKGQVSIEDHIIDGYKRYTDHPLPQVAIEQLLSPFSYYNLNYSIRTASDLKNSGSTGQTYTAMALLCLAKISMIQKEQQIKELGLRFMSIDEAAGIGSNFDMLKRIARKYGYQILSLSIPLNHINEGEQHIYRLYKIEEREYVNHHPIAILSTEA